MNLLRAIDTFYALVKKGYVQDAKEALGIVRSLNFTDDKKNMIERLCGRAFEAHDKLYDLVSDAFAYRNPEISNRLLDCMDDAMEGVEAFLKYYIYTISQNPKEDKWLISEVEALKIAYEKSIEIVMRYLMSRQRSIPEGAGALGTVSGDFHSSLHRVLSSIIGNLQEHQDK